MIFTVGYLYGTVLVVQYLLYFVLVKVENPCSGQVEWGAEDGVVNITFEG